MIIPAFTFRISGFIKDNNLFDTPQEGGLLLAYSDSGKPVIIELVSNKKETTLNDIEAYLENKKQSVIKDKEISAVAGELSYITDFEIELEEAVERFKETITIPDGLSKEDEAKYKRKAVLDYKKKYSNDKAVEIVNERRRIKGGTIIKAVIDTPMDLKFEKIEFKGIEIPKIRSKSLIFIDDAPSATGFYFYSQTDNALPICISPVFNKDGEALNFFSVSLSKMATLGHFNFLVEHIKRSVNKQINENSSIHVPRINYDYEKIKADRDLLSLLKEFRDIAQNKNLTIEDGKRYLEKLELIKEKINKNPKLIIYVNLVFNMLLNKNDIKSLIDTKSNPMVNLSKSFVNLNFSKENPDVKNKLSLITKNIIDEMLRGERECSINAIYHTPALRLDEVPTSWGFMTNNIQSESFVLSSKDTMNLYKELKEAL